MPELAEVETVRRVLKKQILNKKIKNIEIFYPKMIENDLVFFKENLLNEEFLDIKRKGKYLIFETKNHFLISHLRMEGKFFIKEKKDVKEKHEHVIFYFDDFSLRYHDTRKFGRMILIKKEELDKYFEKLGVDANSKDIDVNNILKKINKSKNPIKTILLDQSILAGLGNIYANEVLYESKISPFKKGSDITYKDVVNILSVSKEILDKAILHKGTTIKSYTSYLNVLGGYQKFLKVHMKEGSKCLCGCDIIKTKIGGRSTYLCPNCQRLNEKK